jgi:uncharacterized protein
MNATIPHAIGFARGSHGIEAHGGGGFAFAGMSHVGSILATPTGIAAIAIGGARDIDEAALAPLFAELAERPGSVEYLLIGTGAVMAPIPRALRERLRAAGLRFEAMATGPALRIYNVMQSEKRRVAALLIAAP